MRKINELEYIPVNSEFVLGKPMSSSSLGSCKFIREFPPVTLEDEELDPRLESGMDGINHVNTQI